MIGTIELARRIEAAETRLSLAMVDVIVAAGARGVFGLRVKAARPCIAGPVRR